MASMAIIDQIMLLFATNIKEKAVTLKTIRSFKCNRLLS